MNNVSSDVSMWLNVLNRHPQPTISVFNHEFNQLRKLAPIEVVRVIRTPQGDARLFFIDKAKTIQLLKQLYAFKTKEEAARDFSGMLES